MTQLGSGHKPASYPSPWPSTAYQAPIKSAEVIYCNAVVAKNASGEWVPASADNTLVCHGFARLIDKDSVTGDGTKEIVVDSGCKLLTFSGSSIVQADEGKTVYVVDDQTASLSSSSGTRPVSGKLIKFVSATSGYVAIDPTYSLIAATYDLAAAGLTVQKKTVTVGHADLTDADTSQDINIGTALPANARIVGVDIRALTVFSGGSVSALTVDIGTSGDVDALVDGADLMTTAVDGGPATMPSGIRPNKTFLTAAAQLSARFISASDNLVNLTAGSVIIDVLYVEKA